MGLFSNLFNPPKPAESKKSAYVPRPENPPPYIPPKTEKPDITIPNRVDGVPLAYRYSVKIKVTDGTTLESHVLQKKFMLEAKEIGAEIHVISEGNDVGLLQDRTDMLHDWIKRGDPYFFCLEHLNAENPEEGCTGFLAFYRDKRKGQESREQTVIALTSYKSDEKQVNIYLCHEGDELELEEDYEHEDSVIVVAGGEIGKLPKKYAKRYLEEDAYGAFYEKTEPDGEYEKPYIRIIWN